MRWLFAVLIVLFGWTGSVSGQNFHATPTITIPITLSANISSYGPVISSYEHVYRPTSELRRKFPGKLLLLLPRIHSYPCSLFTFPQWVPTYTLATDLGYRLRSQWLPAPLAPNRLQQVNWTLHSSPQQSRLGGWKESNILYRGSLTYHS